MVVDDYGRFHADPRMLRAKCFPLKTDVRDTDITRWLAACEKAGLLRCYRDEKSRALLEIQGFKQRARTDSRYPSPDNCQAIDGQMTALGVVVCEDVDEGGSRAARAAERERLKEAEEIYEAYPRHIAKKAAIKAIEGALREKPKEVLLEAVKRFALSVATKEPQFIPHPATWFNQGRWDDEDANNLPGMTRWITD